MIDFDSVSVMTPEEIFERLKALADPEAVRGMARFGIQAKTVYGVSIPDLKKMAREAGRDQALSLELWKRESRETRILAAMTGVPDQVTEKQMEDWVRDFDSWEICDQCIMNLFRKTEFSYRKAAEWSIREEEFVKRAGFVLMACLAVGDKTASDEKFFEFFPLLTEGSRDERNMVKKAVNWAIRQIGKRNVRLNDAAIRLSEKIQAQNSKSARWISSDALRELKSGAVLSRLKKKGGQSE